VLAYASNVDLALVVFRPWGSDDYDFAPLAAEGAQGEPGVVVGDPYGSLWTVSRFTFLQTTPDAFLLDCATCGPGDSGGGVFDAGGRLIGILVQQRVEGQEARRTSQYLAVSLPELRLFLDATQANRRPGPPHLSDAWIRFESMRAAH
jgi:S1-C subfamily serine protease